MCREEVGGPMRSLTIVFCAILVLFSFSQTEATVIHVPADSSTIQGGIDGALNGDTVLVAPNTYYEHINFNGKAILVRSETGASTTTISMVYQNIQLVRFENQEDSTSVLEGFRLENADVGSGHPGAISCIHSSPTIRNCLFVNNTGTQGGAIGCTDGSAPRILSNQFIANSAIGGGAIFLDSSSAEVSDNLFLANSAANGGAIFCKDYANASIHYNLFKNNTASTWGGALYCFFDSSTILNNTLDSNSAVNGSGIFNGSASSVIIENNIISNGSGSGLFSFAADLPVLSHNDVWNNSGGDYSGCSPGPGDISADPLFCDPGSGNYYLHATSPCLGAGQAGADIGAFSIGCGRVTVTSGPDQGGSASSDVSIFFEVQSFQDSPDTFDVSVSDELGWNINPTQIELALDPGQTDTADFTVSIPYVSVGTADSILAVAVSRSESTFRDSASLVVTCVAYAEGVDVTAGSDQSGYADSIVSVTFYIQNVGAAPDSYSLDISDTRGWSIVPLHYDLVLEAGQIEPASFTVGIPYVPLGTTDQLTLVATSKTNPLAFDFASVSVTCNAYVEDWSISPGNDVTGPSNSLATAVFFVQNTGLAPDSCRLTVSDSLGWDVQPQEYSVALDPGQQDSLFFEIQIPGAPVEATDKITLTGVSLTNPYVADTASLLVTCESYNVTITEIMDVGNDEGKQVRVEWSSFPPSDPLVTEFSVFRRRDLLLAAPFEYPPGDWDWLITLPAYGETLYSAVVPTLKDSTISEGMHWSVFFVRAGTDSPTVYFDSPVDSGYSLDNLSPSPPTGLFASHEPAVTKLTWGATTSPDFDYYTVYRDTLEGFTPDPSNRLGYTIDTSFVDSTAQLGRTYYYLTSATDFSGNESDPSNEAIGVRYIAGDANADGAVELGDAVYVLNYLFRNGPEPSPMESGDANCDGTVKFGDVIYLINYLFRDGPPPGCP